MFKTLHTPAPMHASKLALERVDSSVELEALTKSNNSNMYAVFQKYMPSFINDIVSIQERLTSLTSFTFVLGRQNKFEYKLEHMSPLEAAEIIISVPEGFRGNLIDYGKLLNRQLIDVYTEVNQVLGEINAFMSVFITNKTHQVSLRDISRGFKDHERAYEELNKARSTYFDAKFSDVSKARLMSVFSNIKNIYTLEEVMVGLKKALGFYNLQSLSSKVKETSELAKMLKGQIDEGNVEHITPAVMASISHGLFAAARFTELVSVLHYDAQVYMTCVDKLYNQILK